MTFPSLSNSIPSRIGKINWLALTGEPSPNPPIIDSLTASNTPDIAVAGLIVGVRLAAEKEFHVPCVGRCALFGSGRPIVIGFSTGESGAVNAGIGFGEIDNGTQFFAVGKPPVALASQR